MVAKSARFLAPIALIAVAIGTYAIIHAGLATHHAATPPSNTTLQLTTGHRRARRGPKFYVVRAGDTLSQISIRTHVPILRLQTLNPSIAPNSLQTGQRLRLRR